MRIQIENTEQIVQLTGAEVGTRARVWIGDTESGIPVQLLVLRVAVAVHERQEEFERELQEQPAIPAPSLPAFPLRLVL